MSFISFTTYQVPGVYIQQVASQQVTVSGLSANIVGIVGPSLGYKTATETQVLGSPSTLNTLNHTGVNQGSVVVANSSGTPYAGSAYVLGTVDGASAPYNQTTITPASGGGGIASGTVVYVTYQYTDENYFLPAVYTNPNAVISDFGQPFTTLGAIASPLSLAAVLAFLNGAAYVAICPTADTGTITPSGGFNGVATSSNLVNAYATLETSGIDLIVPLPVGIGNSQATTVGAALASYLEAQAATGANLAIGIIGYETTVTNGADTIANAIADQRTVEAWPNQVLYFNGSSNIVVGGYYVAAAYAGILASGQPQTPLTRKIISGFSGIPTPMLNTMTLAYKNQLSAAGVAVMEPAAGGGLWCRQGVTTSTTSESTTEISLIRETDAMVELLQNTVNAGGQIGNAFESTSISTLTSLIQGALNNLVDEGTIISFDSLSVIQQGTNPVIALVTFNYSPAYPLNYVQIQFGIDTSTGAVTSPTSNSTTGG